MTSKQCVKVAQLRKKGYTDFESWLKTDDNVYVGRSGRIWIHGDNKRIFNYKGSKWSNPFKVTKECSLEESLTQYIDYIVESGLIHDIHELKGKTLGCWCASSDCHANILAYGEFLKNLVDLLD
jgi:acyl-coenzyme A synthetase/AMP-(fatty) acid ligase